MKNYYQFYLAEKKKLIAEKKETIDARIKKGKKNSQIINWIIDEERDAIIKLFQEPQNTHLGKFYNDLNKIKMWDEKISDEDAFLSCLEQLKISENEEAIILLAIEKASDEMIEYCHSRMYKLQTKNVDNTIKTTISDGNKTDEIKIPIWIGQNKTEFMQLIDGLIRLNRIQPRPNQNKWELIHEISVLFGFQLSKNAISNFGKGNKSKQVPKLLHDLKLLCELHDSHIEVFEVNTRK
jgi:hypothetical protein